MFRAKGKVSLDRPLRDYVVVERMRSDGTVYYEAFTERRHPVFKDRIEKHYVGGQWQSPTGERMYIDVPGLPGWKQKIHGLWTRDVLMNNTMTDVYAFDDPCEAKETVCRLVREDRIRKERRDHKRIVSEGKCCG